MNNHAKQMTEEIERATNLERDQWLSQVQEKGAGGSGVASERGGDITNGQMQRQVGGAALRVGREQYGLGAENASGGIGGGLAGNEVMSHNLVEGVAELVRDEQEIMRPEEFVGEETKLQEEERLQADRENLETEEGQGRSFEVRIMANSQEKVAELAMPQIKEITKGKSFSPAELERSRNWFTNELLRVFNRRIGDRNDAA